MHTYIHDMTWHDMTWHDMTWHDMTWYDMTWHDMTWHYITIQNNTIQYITSQCNSIQYNTLQYNTIQYNTTQHNTIQYNTIQYNTIQHNTTQHNTIQYNTIQYNTNTYLDFCIGRCLSMIFHWFQRLALQPSWIQKWLNHSEVFFQCRVLHGHRYLVVPARPLGANLSFTLKVRDVVKLTKFHRKIVRFPRLWERFFPVVLEKWHHFKSQLILPYLAIPRLRVIRTSASRLHIAAWPKGSHAYDMGTFG